MADTQKCSQTTTQPPSPSCNLTHLRRCIMLLLSWCKSMCVWNVHTVYMYLYHCGKVSECVCVRVFVYMITCFKSAQDPRMLWTVLRVSRQKHLPTTRCWTLCLFVLMLWSNNFERKNILPSRIVFVLSSRNLFRLCCDCLFCYIVVLVCTKCWSAAVRHKLISKPMDLCDEECFPTLRLTDCESAIGHRLEIGYFRYWPNPMHTELFSE